MTRRPGQAGSAAGRAGLIASGASAALTFAVAVTGPSVMEPVLPGRSGQPPWALDAHLSPYLAVALTAVALTAGILGLVLTLRAVRSGWSVPTRAVLAGGLLAAAALTLVPPFGSSDHLSYAAYGRMLVTGHNPYTTTPAQLAALGDPVARAVQDWFTTPSVYGPLATAIEGLASLIGGTSARLTVFVLGLVNLAAFGAIGLLLHRMTRGDQARQLRTALLWAANPLMLMLVVAGAHIDVQAAFFAVAAVAVMFGPWAPEVRAGPGGLVPPKGVPGGMVPPVRGPGGNGTPPRAGGSGGSPPRASTSFTAGILVGLGFAVKVSDVLVGLGMAIALVMWLWPARRRLLLPLAALGAGFAVTAGAALAIGGSAMLRQLSRESDMVSIGSPWRVIRTVIHLAVTGTAATDMVKFGATALAVVLAVLLIRGLPGVLPGRDSGRGEGVSPAMPGAGYPAAGASVVFALVLAWLFAWPYVLPWYDALAWALLPLVPLASAAGGGVFDGICWLLLARTSALGFGYLPARQTDATLPHGLAWLQPVLRHGVTPVVLAGTTVLLVVLMVRSRPQRQTVPPGGAAASDSSTVRPQAPGRTPRGSVGPQRCPGAEDTPPEASEAPARGAGR